MKKLVLTFAENMSDEEARNMAVSILKIVDANMVDVNTMQDFPIVETVLDIDGEVEDLQV